MSDIKIPCALPRLEKALGGGFKRGEIYLFLAYTGTGKTVFSHQLLCSVATNEMDHKVLLLLSESSNYSDKRVMTNIFGVNYKKVDAGFRPPEEHVGESKFSSIKSRSWIRGMPSADSPDEFLEELESKYAEFPNADMLILDELSGSQYLNSKTRTNISEANQLPCLIKKLKVFAQQHNIAIIFTRQANDCALEETEITARNVKECKTLGAIVDYTLGFTGHKKFNGDPLNACAYQYLTVTDAENTSTVLPVRADFAHQRIDFHMPSIVSLAELITHQEINLQYEQGS